MIVCSLCGRPVERLPAWLVGVKVDFQCGNCPSRQVKPLLSASEPSTVKESGEFAELEAMEEPEADDDL